MIVVLFVTHLQTPTTPIKITDDQNEIPYPESVYTGWSSVHWNDTGWPSVHWDTTGET